jgi:biopolymer transport protein ExbB
MNPWQFLERGDGVSMAVALVLLAMSVASWVVILWKSWLLHRVNADLRRSLAAFWQAPSMAQARQQIQAFDRQGLLASLIDATGRAATGTLASAGDASQQLTRSLRDALHQGLGRLQLGQVLLASVGATAPFVGLLGTVWGIYHALLSIAGSAQLSLDKVAGPVGESLIMTAAGLVVAIPAVLAYNVLGRVIGRIEADLEGFAHDLRELLGGEVPRGTEPS